MRFRAAHSLVPFVISSLAPVLQNRNSGVRGQPDGVILGTSTTVSSRDGTSLGLGILVRGNSPLPRIEFNFRHGGNRRVNIPPGRDKVYQPGFRGGGE